jgi:ribosomal protein RSM22 (predicted rRNA methylase)
MELPGSLRKAIERALECVPLAQLRQAADMLSRRYRSETRDGRLHLAADLAVQAYLASRLPSDRAGRRSARRFPISNRDRSSTSAPGPAPPCGPRATAGPVLSVRC